MALSIACFYPGLSMTSVCGQTPNAGQEKDQRTPEQQKIDSQLLYAIYQMRGEAEAKGVPTEEIQLERDAKGRVLVDVRMPVTPRTLARIEKLGGQVVSSSKEYHSIIAYLALDKI